MLWKFYKNDPEVCHYLFGTMHLATSEAYTHVDLASKYILQCATYAAEMDLEEGHSEILIRYLMLPEGENFSQYFRPKQYNRYRKIVKKAFGLDILEYEKYTPFFINNLISEKCFPQSKSQALDHFLWSFAIENGKEMTGVESLEDQLKILQQIPKDFQVKAFRSSLKNVSAYKKKLQKLNLYYAKGRHKELYQVSKKSMGKIRKLMIYDRNFYMLDRILDIVKTKPSFIAVGAAHLFGQKGLIHLLDKEGYTVIQVHS